MKIQGPDLKMETRHCKKCPRSFRVWEKSTQEYCSNFCKSIDATTVNGRYRWGDFSTHVVKPPKSV